MKIFGMNEIKYIGTTVEGHNCEFTYGKKEMVKHEIFVEEDGKKYVIRLETENTVCGSGWTTATEGIMEIESIEQFPPMGYRYVEPMTEYPFPTEADIEIEGFKEGTTPGYKCPGFSISKWGNDMYYPCGGHSVNMDFFRPNGKRAPEKRRVMIFKGDSSAGKSWLAAKANVSVYETDKSAELPSEIESEIIVLGNKYNFSLEDIKEKIAFKEETEVVVVDFSF
jgi:hypothetical protein